MGLEMIGFARANIDDVWIDPVDYQRRSSPRRPRCSTDSGVQTMIYNHQLCLHRPRALALRRQVDQRLEERVPPRVR